MTYSRPLDHAMTGSQGPEATIRDRIFLSDHVVNVEIGAFQQERGVTQRLRFNLIAELEARPAGAQRDDVDGIVTYDVLADAIAAELSQGRLNLLETLAEGIAARVLAMPSLATVTVRIEKLDRLSGSLGIEIARTAMPTAQATGTGVPPDAVVILVDEARLADPGLGAALLAEIGDHPALLCVAAQGASEIGSDTGLAPPVQRRIDLLAFEQAAWRLAACDRRFVVVDSRTELEWGLRHGQISVWAPSKMVVDARDDTPASPLAMSDLAIWLAGRLGIGRIALFGAPQPEAVPPQIAISVCNGA